MATSGTVSTTVFNTRKVIDRAFGKCKLSPQQITSEYIDIAKDLLFLHLSTLVSEGIKLWNVDRIILPLYEREIAVPAPVGVVDMLDCNLRTAQRHTEGTQTATEGIVANAFDGNLNTTCTQVTPAGNITLRLTSALSIPIYGILPNVGGSWDYVVEGSNDGTNYTAIITKTAQTVIAGQWLWEDVEGVDDYEYYRLRATGTTVLDVRELVFQNLPQEIPLYKLNRTDYSNLPNKTRTGRPTQFWWDKQRSPSIITVWPNPELQFTFAQLTCYAHRHIQDVGTLTQEIEVPQRWYQSIVSSLAEELAREIKEVKETLIPILEAKAMKDRRLAWTGESDGSDIFWRPNISPYTR